MFNNPLLDEIPAHLQQKEAIREVPSRTPLYPKKTRKVRKVFIMGV